MIDWGMSKFEKAISKQWVNTLGHAVLLGAIPAAVACYYTTHEGLVLAWLGSFAGFTVGLTRELYHGFTRGSLNLLDRYRDTMEAGLGGLLVGGVWAVF